MSNPVSYVNTLVSNIVSLINDLEQAQLLNDRVTADATLITRYFASQGARTDIVAQDVTNALAALTQLAFTFNSGAPTQKSYMYKLIP